MRNKAPNITLTVIIIIIKVLIFLSLLCITIIIIIIIGKDDASIIGSTWPSTIYHLDQV